jgi:hypothetical protein
MESVAMDRLGNFMANNPRANFLPQEVQTARSVNPTQEQAVKYNGDFMGMPMYTDGLTKSSFVIHPGENFEQALARIRKPFGK